ncbi:MAG: hypothetical protein JOZ54_12720 [Acidobacteria bacterium]|nr:hypothetical protein [Acidobacteriota bacterium]
MPADEVIRQVMNGEFLEQQALGKCPKIALESLDDLQYLKRIDPQFAKGSKRIEIRAQTPRSLGEHGFQIRLGQVYKELLINHDDHLTLRAEFVLGVWKSSRWRSAQNRRRRRAEIEKALRPFGSMTATCRCPAETQDAPNGCFTAVGTTD